MNIVNDVIAKRAEFVQRFGVPPTVVYLGAVELRELCRSASDLGVRKTGNITDSKLAGMTIVAVDSPNYLSLGT